METIENRLTLLLRAYRTIYFCDACLALKMGAFPREVQDALVAIGRRRYEFQLAPGRCSECLQAKPVVRALVR